MTTVRPKLVRWAALISLSTSLTSISLPLTAQQEYAMEDAFATSLLQDVSFTGLKESLDWTKVPDAVKTGYRYDLRIKFNGKLPAMDALAPSDRKELGQKFRDRLYVDFLSTKANPADVGVLVKDPPSTKLVLDQRALDTLKQVFPFSPAVAASASEAAQNASTPLVLSQSGYRRSPGYYTANPNVRDTGPSRRDIIVDPLGFAEAALILRNPVMEDTDSMSVGRCSAVRIAHNWLVTARHCVGDSKDRNAKPPPPPLEFVTDDNLIKSSSADGRGFVLLQKSARPDVDYAALKPCLAGQGALTISDNEKCPYSLGHIVAIEVPGGEACVHTIDGSCGLIRPDIALLQVDWVTKPPESPMAVVPNVAGGSLADLIKKHDGITFAGYGLSRSEQGGLTSRSPLIVGFHSGTVEVAGSDVRTEYQWTQDLSGGKDAICGGDSGGPVYLGLVRGHRNTMPHQVLAIMSRVTPPGATNAGPTAQSAIKVQCYAGRINVVALPPWREWICKTTKSAMEGCVP